MAARQRDQLPPPASALREALDCESKRLLRSPAVLRALENLRFYVVNSKPELFFDLGHHWNPYRRRVPAGVAANRALNEQLLTVSRLLVHSRRLNAFADLKRSYWSEIITAEPVVAWHRMLKFEVRNWLWLVEDDEFPTLSLKLVDEALMQPAAEAITFFFTAPPENSTADQSDGAPDPDAIKVDLRLSVESDPEQNQRTLRLVESTLDRVFASSSRQFAIRQLELRADLSRREGENLECFKRLLAKCHDVYKIQDVQLSLSELAASTVIACWAANLTSSLPTRNILGSLTSANIDLDLLCLEEIVSVCSSLRYASRMRHVSFGGGLDGRDKSERALSWCWLAFGIFYPASKKLTDGDRLDEVAVSFNVAETEWKTALSSVMADPVSALLDRAKDSSRTNPATPRMYEIVVCHVKSSAVFYPIVSVEAKPNHTFNHECDLEVLVQENGWTCAVLPGIGLGWVKNDEIESTEHEQVDSGSGRGASLPIHSSKREHLLMLRAFDLERVGGRVASIYLPNSIAIVELESILRHCGNLKRVNLVDESTLGSQRIPASMVDAVLDAFEAGYCLKVESIFLDANAIDDRQLVRLAHILSDASKLRGLRQLHAVVKMRPDTLASFRGMLRVNKTLQFVHLPGPFWGVENSTGDPKMLERHLINEQSQRQVLPGKLPLLMKLALLSVLRSNSSTPAASRFDLDSFMVAVIFRFAADGIARRILWEQRPFEDLFEEGE